MLFGKSNGKAGLEKLHNIFLDFKIKAKSLGAQKRCLDLGGTLPLRVNPEAQAALRTALASSQQPPSFYWIGLMGTSQGWIWADGEKVEESLADWFEDPGEIKEGEALAAVMGRPAGWKWMTSSQSVWNPWICQTSKMLLKNVTNQEF